VQQRLTLVVTCLLLSSERRRGLHCNNQHATSRRRERVLTPNQRQANAGCACSLHRNTLLPHSRYHTKFCCSTSNRLDVGRGPKIFGDAVLDHLKHASPQLCHYAKCRHSRSNHTSTITEIRRTEIFNPSRSAFDDH